MTAQEAMRSIKLVVPVVSGLANASLQDTSHLPESIVRHATLLCAYAVLHPALLRADLRFLVDAGEGGALLTLDAKRAWLSCEKERLMRLGEPLSLIRMARGRRCVTSVCSPGKSAITIVTGRTGIMHDICATLTPPGSGAAVGISVAFRDERAAGDGLRREWFQLVGAEFADPQVNLFCSYDGGRTLQPSPSSDINDTHISYFELIGKVVGLALLHGETVPMRFSAPFLKRILGHTLTPEDLSIVDPEGYKSIKFVIDADDVEDLCLTFSESSDHPAGKPPL